MALIDKDQIRAEIERRMFEDYNGPNIEQNETAQGVCAGLLAFLYTLPEQPVEGLEMEIEKEYSRLPPYLDLARREDYTIIKAFARHFAEWGAEHARKEDK